MAGIEIQKKLENILKNDVITEEIVINNPELIEETKEKIEHLEGFFQELDDVWAEREKYALHWAFSNAASQLNSQLRQIEQDTNNRPFDDEEIDQITHDAKKEIKRTANQYSILARFTMSLDIIVSVILILGVTIIAQQIESSLHSISLVITFIGVVAFAKVSLDRFFIIPWIDKWGWQRYHTLTHSIEYKMADLMARKIQIKSKRLMLATPIQQYRK